MNRLQKKCLIATAGIHLSLLVILLVGPAFFNPDTKPDNTRILTMIPPDVVEGATTGMRNAAPPQQQQPVQPPPPPQPAQVQQVQPRPVVTLPPKPVDPTPTPSVLKSIEKFFKPEPAKPETPAPQEHQIQPNLKPVVRNPSKNTAPTTPTKSQPNPNNTKNVLSGLKSSLSKATEINLSGDSDAAAANYADAVRSIYDAAWTLPNTIAKDENITVRVTIARDGTVISARIVTPSGDQPADASVQRALDRVTFIAPFPDGWKDSQRTFPIVFNPQVKNSE